MSGGTVKVRVREHRALSLAADDYPGSAAMTGHFTAGDELDLPADAARALERQGFVENAAKPKRSPARRRPVRFKTT